MTQKKKLLYNTIFSLIYQAVAFICGFILPKCMLRYYGSEVHGLIDSITHFLGFITLAECGIGAVVQSALYKPLAEKNETEISKIIISAERFFRKISYLLIIYTAIIVLVYPLISDSSFDRSFTAGLILIAAFSSFCQYFFSISYSLLLEADALAFIPFITRSVALILNVVLSFILMRHKVDIRIVKLASSFIFLIQPLVYRIYVNKHYHLNKKLVLTEEPIKQKWNGFAQHIAAAVLRNTDTVVLTLFSTLESVSVYSVYCMVIAGIKQIVFSLTAGVQPLFGNLYAKNDTENLNKVFAGVEWSMHTAIVFLFTCTALLIVPFVSVYTKDITDANYIEPLFGILLCAAFASHCIRLPYNMMVLAAGHYKQTQLSCIIEALLNIVISVLLVVQFGLPGVAIGTLVAMIYRTCYLAWYLSKAILYRKLSHFLKHIAVDALSIICMVLGTFWIKLSSVTYSAWFIQALETAAICGVISIAVNFIFYKTHTIDFISKIFRRRKKKA